ncbi:MAG: DUF445 domain-containing protein [Gammaproteobacteria bacterium]|nr:DUF445 domain-containing protein [Gammaproteobacteria bacterium]
MDKSLISNLLALLVVVVGLFLNAPYRGYVLNTGLFALSGGVTNWLAIHMLFEKVPGFYGSGVIPLRFEEFKVGIRKLIMEQFFNKSNMDNFFQSATEITDRLEAEIASSIDRLDLDKVFESLLDAVMDSSLGSMMGIVGGRNALNGLRDPFKEKLSDYFHVMFGEESLRGHLQDAVKNSMESDAVLGKLEDMIDSRLDEMTPQLVKEIIQAMIKEHLGWLVVWGCVIGGAVGLTVTVLMSL